MCIWMRGSDRLSRGRGGEIGGVVVEVVGGGGVVLGGGGAMEGFEVLVEAVEGPARSDSGGLDSAMVETLRLKRDTQIKNA